MKLKSLAPPFGAQAIPNGHDWVERQAQRQEVTVAKSGNCFVEGSDFAQVNRLAARRQSESAILSVRTDSTPSLLRPTAGRTDRRA